MALVDGSAELYARGEIGQNSADLLGKGIVKNADSAELQGKSIIRHIGIPVELLGKAAIRHVGTPVELLARSVIRHDGVPVELLGKLDSRQFSSAEAYAHLIVRHISSTELLCKCVIRHIGIPIELFGRAEVGQGSGELLARFEVGQDSSDFLGKTTVRHPTSLDLWLSFYVRPEESTAVDMEVGGVRRRMRVK